MKIHKLVQPNTVSAKDMADGEIGIIVKCSYDSYLNQIVQAYENRLIALGEKCGKSWSNRELISDLYVQILPKGTLLKI